MRSGRKNGGDVELWAYMRAVARYSMRRLGPLSGRRRAELFARVLRRFGNMSSATVPFVLRTMLDRKLSGLGCGWHSARASLRKA